MLEEVFSTIWVDVLAAKSNLDLNDLDEMLETAFEFVNYRISPSKQLLLLLTLLVFRFQSSGIIFSAQIVEPQPGLWTAHSREAYSVHIRVLHYTATLMGPVKPISIILSKWKIHIADAGVGKIVLQVPVFQSVQALYLLLSLHMALQGPGVCNQIIRFLPRWNEAKYFRCFFRIIYSFINWKIVLPPARWGEVSCGY